MTEKKDGGPAFAHGNPEQGGDPGMTLRDWFAGQALAGLMAAEWYITEPEGAAEQAYKHADALLAEREKEG